jgi:hypothetical protein
MKRNTKVNSGSPRVGVGEILDGPAKDMENPLPLRALLTRPVVVSVANYCVIALLDITAGTLIPLVWSTSVEFGGLNMTPASIGLWISGYGLMNGVFQFVALPRLVGRFGPRRVFITSVLCHFPFYMMFPLANLALRHSSPSHGRNLAVALLIMLQLTVTSISAMGMGKWLINLTLWCVVTEVLRIDKVQYLCIFPLLLLTSGPSALQMGSRRRWYRSNAQLDLLQFRRCSPFHWKTTFWVETLRTS